MSDDSRIKTIHAVVLDYGCGDDEDYKLCFVCETKEEAISSALEMGGDHKHREIEIEGE